MKQQASINGLALAAAFGFAIFAGPASARAPFDPDKAQALATQIEGALSQAGCGSTRAQDVGIIQSTIAASAASPSEATAALSMVQSSAGLCPEAKDAVASVDQDITMAMTGARHYPGPGIGPGGSAPFGAPPVYVGGGGSNYQTP